MTKWKKQNNTFLILIAVATFLSCATQKNTDPTPDCIRDFIERHKNDRDWLVGSVDEFEYQGRLVYAFNPSKNIADGTTLIKSADCKDMCSVGGFAGLKNNQCNGDNFFTKSVLKRSVWKRD